MDLRGPSSGAEIAVFVFFAAVAIAGALGTVLARNPIRCAVGLFFNVVSLAGLYLTLSAHFLAVIQLIVYAGAVVVLFVFVVMILGPGADTPRDRRVLLPRIAAAVAVVAAAVIIVPQVGYVRRVMPTRPPEFGTLWQVGQHLFTKAVLPFELVSVLLVVAMVGAMGIARGPTRKTIGDKGPGPEPHKRAGGRLVAPLDPRLSTRDARVLSDNSESESHPEGHS